MVSTVEHGTSVKVSIPVSDKFISLKAKKIFACIKVSFSVVQRNQPLAPSALTSLNTFVIILWAHSLVSGH